MRVKETLEALRALINANLVDRKSDDKFSSVHIMSENELLQPGRLNRNDFPACTLFEAMSSEELGPVANHMRRTYVLYFMSLNRATKLDEARFHENYGVYTLEDLLYDLLVGDKVLSLSDVITGMKPSFKSVPVEFIGSDQDKVSIFMVGKKITVEYYYDFAPWESDTIDQ